ncbi:MAG: sigma-70 family RNA polymerase sigma factor [Planctomycetes bacterium]|nr:sigma-70 family RNA polymerase sigma factor [Planctomycetota bacterium]
MNPPRDTTPLDLAELHRHAPGLRALVRELVLDDSRVDDVLQETWLRALESPPRDRAALGRWLRTVARRLAFRELRRERMAPHADAAGEPDDPLPPPDRIVEREAARREVVEVVLGLDEPYRSTVLYRYFEGLTSREIARRAQLPLDTVRTRLKRGLALVRGRLDANHGGEPARWHRALLPLATLPIGVTAAPVGAGTAGTWWLASWRAALALLAVVGAALATVLALRTPAADVAPAAPATLVAFSADDLRSDSRGDDLAALAVRAPLQAATTEASPADADAPSAARPTLDLRGSVLEPGGRPLGGARVELRLAPLPGRDAGGGRRRDGGADGARTPDQRATERRVPDVAITDAAGRFRFVGPAFPETAVGLVVTHPRFATTVVDTSWHFREGVLELGAVVADPGRDLVGRVEDAGGVAVGGATVELGAERAEPAGAPSLAVGRATSDPDGRFVLPRAPARLALHLTALRPGGRPAPEVALPPGAAPDWLRLVLETEVELRGRFVDASGAPLPDRPVAFVASSERSALQRAARSTSDADGTFVLRAAPSTAGTLLALDPTSGLVATADGVMPAATDPGAPPVELRLPAPRSVAGRVLAADTGQPLAGATVDVLGAPRQGAAGELRGRAATTDVDGRFRIDGLPAARIALRATAPGRPPSAPLLIDLSRGDAAAPAEFELAPGADLRVRVLTAEGAPVAAARVRVLGGAPSVPVAGRPDGPADAGAGGRPGHRGRLPRGPLGARSGWTDADGSAAIDGLPGDRPLTVEVEPTDAPGLRVELPPLATIATGAAPIELRLPAPARIELTLDGSLPGRALLVAIDADGARRATPVTATGLTRLAGLAPGHHEVWLEPRELAAGVLLGEAELAPGGAARFAFRAADARPARLVGRVETAAPGDELLDCERLEIRLRRAGERRALAAVPLAADGRFELAGLPPGRYDLELGERGAPRGVWLAWRSTGLVPGETVVWDLAPEVAGLLVTADAAPLGAWLHRPAGAAGEPALNLHVRGGDHLRLPAGDWRVRDPATLTSTDRIDSASGDELRIRPGTLHELHLTDR